MNSQLTLQCLPVADFFSRINWQGLEIVPERTTAKVARATSPSPRRLDRNSSQALCLSVGEFFGTFDWQGETASEYYVDSDATEVEETIQGISFSLTLSVRDLFSLVAWDGRSQFTEGLVNIPVKPSEPKLEAAKVDRLDSSPVLPATDDTAMNLNDLSNLF